MPLQPQFFDIFGLMSFVYIAFIAFWGLHGRRFKKWELAILLAIGLGGLLVDGLIVYSYYLR